MRPKQESHKRSRGFIAISRRSPGSSSEFCFLSYSQGTGFAAGEEAPIACLNCVLRSGHTAEERAEMLEQLWSMFQDLTGVATDQLALSLQEIPSQNAMELGQIMKPVG